MSPETKAIVYGGGGGVAVLGLATLVLIAWMFLSALPNAVPDRAVAQNDVPPGEPIQDAEVGKPRPGTTDRDDADPPDPNADSPPPDAESMPDAEAAEPDEASPGEDPPVANGQAPTEPAPLFVSAGDVVEVPLTDQAGEASVELIAAPEGAEREGDTLCWTPMTGDVGSHDVTARLTMGDVVHERTWTINVRQKTLPVAFLVRGCDPSVDGARLIVWGHDWPLQPVSRNEMPGFEPANWRLAVVDLADMSLAAETEFDRPIHQVEFCGTEVVVADSIDGLVTLTRLSANDLSETGQTQVLGGEMTSIADHWLAVRSSGLSAEMQLRLYSLPDLAPRDGNPGLDELPTSADAFRDVRIEEYETVFGARELADGWLLDGALWDDELRTVLLLIEPRDLVTLPGGPAPTIDTQRVLSGFVYDQATAATAGGRVPPHISALINGASRGNDAGYDSPHVAARFSARFDQESAILERTDIGADAPSQSIPLRIGPTDRNYPYPDARMVQVATSPERVFATLAGETYVVPLEPRPAPFRIAPRQSELELAAGRRSTRVTYAADDAGAREGATRFELEIPALGTADGPYRLESDDGEFRIDPVDLNALSVSIWAGVPRGQPAMVRQELQQRFDRAAVAYERYIGRRPPAGIAVRIDAYVRATADNGDVAVLQHAYMVMIPMPIFERNEP